MKCSRVHSALLMAMLSLPLHADVVLEGNGQILSGDMVIAQDMGETRGNNLLHTFSRFDINPGESATFTGDPLIDYIIARVTGSESSMIDGLIRSDITGADLFLINPNGVVFGEGAQVHVDGSFIVTSANSIRFTDDSELLVTDSGASGFTSAAPAAFGFTAAAGDITFNGVDLVASADKSVVSAVRVLGGDIQMQGSAIGLSGGDIDLVATAAPVTVPLDIQSRLPVQGGGSITISNEVYAPSRVDLDVSGESPGKLSLLGHNIVLDQAFVFSDTQGGSDGKGINILAAGSLTLVNGSRITTDVNGAGRGGDLTVTAEEFSLSGVNTSLASNALRSTGSSGNIVITADTITLSDEASISSVSFTAGDAGTINLSASEFSLTGGASVSGQAVSSGAGADIVIVATDQVFMNASGLDQGDATSISVSSQSFLPFIEGGDAGDIVVTAPSVTLQAGSRITAEAVTPFSGAPGAITINSEQLNVDSGSLISTRSLSAGAAGSVVLNAETLIMNGPSTTISSSTLVSGAGGDVRIVASSADINNALVTVETRGSGKGGSLQIDVRDLTIDSTLLSGRTTSQGDGGSLALTGEQILLTGSTRIDTSSVNTGNAGDIAATASRTLTLSGPEVEIDSRAAGDGSGGTISLEGPDISIVEAGISVSTTATGLAGSVSIVGASLALDNGVVQATTTADGNGGEILLAAKAVDLKGTTLDTSATSAGDAGSIVIESDDLVLDSATLNSSTAASGVGGSIIVRSDLSTNVTDTDISVTTTGAGNAGAISINTDQLRVHGARIEARTEGSGAGGLIGVVANDVQVSERSVIDTNTAGTGVAGNLLLDVSGSILVSGADTALTSQSLGAGSGGNITLQTPELTLNEGAVISATAKSAGSAGNINLLNGVQLELLTGAQVQTNAEASGGGNITVEASDRIFLSDSLLTATALGSATDSDAGNVTIDPIFLILDNSQIVAQAQVGDGGQINLTVENFLADVYSFIDATSELGNDGEVRITSPDNSVTGVVGALNVSIQEQDELLRTACSARALEDRSSLVILPMSATLVAPGDPGTTTLPDC